MNSLLTSLKTAITEFISDFNESDDDDSSFSNSLSSIYNSTSTSSSSSSVKGLDDEDDDLVDIAYIAGSCIYFLMMVVLTVIYIRKYRQNRNVRWTYVSTYVTIIGLVFLVLRFVWCLLNLEAINKYSAFVVNRIDLFLYLLIFGVLLFLVIDTAMGTAAGTFARKAFTGDLDFKFLSRPIQFGFSVFVIFSSAVILASLIESFFFTGKTTWYKYSEILLAVIFFLYSVLYVVFGVLLYRKLYDTSLPWPELVKILLYWVGIAVCFFIKSSQFILLFVDLGFPQAAQVLVFYVVAELGPIGLYAWLTSGNVQRVNPQAENNCTENVYYLFDKSVGSEIFDKDDFVIIQDDDDDEIF